MNLWVKICANTSLEDAQLAAEAGADAVGFVFAPSPRRVTAELVARIVPDLPATVEKIGVFVDAPFEAIAANVERCSLTGVQLHFDAPPELSARLRQQFGPALRILRVVHFDAQQATNMKGTGFSPYIDRRGSLRALEAAEKAVEHGQNPTRIPSGAKAPNYSALVPYGLKPVPFNGDSSSAASLAPEGCSADAHCDALLIDSRTATAAGGTGQAFDWSLASETLFQNAKAGELRLIVAGGLQPDNVAQAIVTLRPWGVDVVSGVEAAPGRKDAAKVRAFVANARAAARG